MLKLFATSIAIVLADQVSKRIITETMRLREAVEVTSFFDIIYVHNTGAAFSFLANAGGWQRYFLATVSLVVSLALPFYIKKNQHNKPLAYGLTLIFGGAVGNLIDKLSQGYVVDFVSLHLDGIFYWPAFNVADSAITVGAAFIIYDALKKKGQAD